MKINNEAIIRYATISMALFTAIIAMYSGCQYSIFKRSLKDEERHFDSSFKLARNSAKLDSQTMLYEIRPYVTLYSIDTTTINNVVEISITFKNMGKTPAYKVVATGDAFAAPFIPKDLKVAIGDTGRFTHCIVGADNPYTTMVPIFYYNESGSKIAYTNNNINEIYKSKAFLFCGGTINYKDIFHNSYYTNFLLKYDYNKRGFTPCKIHNDAN